MSDAKILYKNNRLRTLYFATTITIAMPLFVYYMIIRNFQNLRAEFTSTFTFILFIAFVILSTHILLATILWIHQKYVLRIIKIDEQTIEVKTWSIIGLHGNKQYPKEILNKTKFMDGTGFYGRGPVVNAPWLKLKTPDNKTLVVDLQGEFYF